MKKKIFCFDLDNVICNTKKNYYKSSKPNSKAIKLINDLYNEGHYIKIFTARYMGRSNDNIIKASRLGLKLTKKQLKIWKIQYHKLIMGKPSYDLFVDDKAYGYNSVWIKDLRRKYL
jgi:hypothetical protein